MASVTTDARAAAANLSLNSAVILIGSRGLLLRNESDLEECLGLLWSMNEASSPHAAPSELLRFHRRRIGSWLLLIIFRRCCFDVVGVGKNL